MKAKWIQSLSSSSRQVLGKNGPVIWGILPTCTGPRHFASAIDLSRQISFVLRSAWRFQAFQCTFLYWLSVPSLLRSQRRMGQMGQWLWPTQWLLRSEEGSVVLYLTFHYPKKDNSPCSQHHSGKNDFHHCPILNWTTWVTPIFWLKALAMATLLTQSAGVRMFATCILYGNSVTLFRRILQAEVWLILRFVTPSTALALVWPTLQAHWYWPHRMHFAEIWFFSISL